jgi:hypothetical protein
MHRNTRAVGAVTLAFVVAAIGGSAAWAADPTIDTPHPAHIHEGSCPAPGKVVAPLTDVMTLQGATMGQPSAIPIEVSGTKAPMAYADILATPHSIVVHKSADEINVYILCGDIGGPEMGAGALPIGLGALNDSGFTGVATLHDNGDGTTQVNVLIIPPNGMMTPPMGSPLPSMNM